nr:hypothetical protein [Pandoravirus belohorizontensis]
MDVDFVSLRRAARMLYATRDDAVGHVVSLYHECATGGFFLVDSPDALADAQQRWAVRTLDLPPRRRRCMRFRVVTTVADDDTDDRGHQRDGSACGHDDCAHGCSCPRPFS